MHRVATNMYNNNNNNNKSNRIPSPLFYSLNTYTSYIKVASELPGKQQRGDMSIIYIHFIFNRLHMCDMVAYTSINQVAV